MDKLGYGRSCKKKFLKIIAVKERIRHIISYFLAYFQKMKVGLSNHQSVCPPLITFEQFGRMS
jgi:hypothetical protein